jgi:hypothetical protein
VPEEAALTPFVESQQYQPSGLEIPKFEAAAEFPFRRAELNLERR